MPSTIQPMPTPFTHLKIAQDLLGDSRLAPIYRGLLFRHRPAFQLGSIAADARVASGVGREVTHFYAYDRYITERPWHRLLNEHPTLACARDQAHLAFLAGYAAHLAADEAWALKMVRPHFAGREWPAVERRDQFFALHLILTAMDERDQAELEGWQAETLGSCQPGEWLPFMSVEALCAWRDLIVGQLMPDGRSRTLEIFGKRLGKAPALIRSALDDPAEMNQRLWRHIPKALLEAVERQIYVFTRDQLAWYLTRFMPALESGT